MTKTMTMTGVSHAGKCAVTIISDPRYSLKQEAIGLADTGEIPLVVVDVQCGGPSTGQRRRHIGGDAVMAAFQAFPVQSSSVGASQTPSSPSSVATATTR